MSLPRRRKSIRFTFLAVSRSPLIIIILLQTISLLRPSCLAKVVSTSIVPIIVPLLKARVGRGMTLALIREHLMLSKGEGQAQYLGTMRLSNEFKLANVYK